MKTLLMVTFVGGSLDGHRCEITDETAIPVVVNGDEYRLELIYVANEFGSDPVMIVKGMSPMEAINRLLENYRARPDYRIPFEFAPLPRKSQ